LDLVDVPRAARRAAAQRIDRQLKLVTRLQGLARPTVADEAARRATFEVPELAGAIRALDVQNDEGVRAGVAIFLHRADELDRMLLVEHGERVVREHDTAGAENRTADE